ncbi:T9SS type A sorting domain-containing protein [Catalinimonas alkaloidigena]|uniref:T9SS type A sorting domain-containing protein n=1 Tax=Catalinimonas alkaloidigena TaxID=1075417 RepID=UPI00240515A5|nr:T9SS type A sorting domain-containing protein [Catalinimonas alkaloidigena]
MKEGVYLLAGRSDSNISGDKSENRKGGNDYWAVRLSEEEIPLIKSISLVNAGKHQVIHNLKDGDVVDLEALGSSNFLSIQVQTTPEIVDNVKLEISGPINHEQYESKLPYVLFGDNNGNIISKEWPEGEYTFTTIAYLNSSEKKKDSVSITFQLKHNAIPTKQKVIWDRTLGGNNRNEVSETIPTPDGGFLVGGYSDSDVSGDKSEDSKGGSEGFDYWIVKIDAEGHKVWDKTLGGSGDDFLRSLISTSDGGFLLGGNSNSPVSGDKSEDSKGSYDFWIIKIDSLGNKLWDKTIGGDAGESLRDIFVTDNGEYLLSGVSSSNISGDKQENSKGGTDFWLVKTDASGNIIWDKAFGGNSSDNLITTIPAYGGGYLLAGYSYSPASGDKSENNYNTSSNYWIVKTDEQGNKIWDKTIGGTIDEVLRSAVRTSDEGFLLAGHSKSNAGADKSEDSKGSYDYWVVKIDAQGNKIWDKTIGGNGYDDIRNIIRIGKDTYALAGTSTSDVSGDKSDDTPGYNAYWMVVIDERGNRKWDTTIGGNGGDRLLNFLYIPDGGYLLSGNSSSDKSGDKSEDRKGVTDYWIVKIPDLETILSIDQLLLVNAQNNTVIQEIQEGDVINLNDLSTSSLTIIAIPNSALLGSISFQLSGSMSYRQTENIHPYALFGDDPRGNYNGQELLPGQYQITATPYSYESLEGIPGTPKTVNFTLIDSDQPLYDISLDLYDAVTDTKLFTLENGATFDLNSIANHQLTVLMNTMPEVVGSVKAVLSGPINYSHIENTIPYALFRNRGNDYFGRNFPPGAYTLSATAYEEANARGAAWVTKTVSFFVTDDGLANNVTESNLRVFPVPTSSTLNIRIESMEGRLEIKLLDKLGNTLLQQLSEQPFHQMDLSSFPKGVYFIKITSNECTQTLRVVKE